MVSALKVDGVCVNITDEYFNAAKCQSYQNGLLGMYDDTGSRRRREPVELHANYTCGARVATIQPGYDCSAMSGLFGSVVISAVKFRGQCVNITDAHFPQVCAGYARE